MIRIIIFNATIPLGFTTTALALTDAPNMPSDWPKPDAFDHPAPAPDTVTRGQV